MTYIKPDSQSVDHRSVDRDEPLEGDPNDMAYASKFEFLKRTFNKETNRDEPVDAEPEYFIQLELR